MKKNAIFFFSLCLALTLFGQDTNKHLNFYIQNFQYQKALEYIDSQPLSKDLLMQKAFCYKSLGHYQKSIDILQPLAQEYTQDRQIKAELAINYQMAGQLQQSADVYSDLITMDSISPYFKIQKADVLYQQSKYEQALNIYQELLKKDSMKNMLRRSAQCFEKMNLTDSAMLYYKEAWKINSKDAFSAANLINLCIRSKRFVEAMEYSDSYIQSDSTDKQINVLNALSYYSADLYEEAVKRFSKCYQQGDSSLVVNRSLGIAYYSLNESEEANKYLDRAYAQDTTNTNVLYCLAVTCNDLSKHTLAAQYFNKLLDLTIPANMTLYLYYKGLGIAYEKNQQNQEAVDTYLKALTYATDNQKLFLYYTIAQLYELFLRNDKESYNYYLLYQKGLNDYMDIIKKDEEKNKDEIRDGKMKIEKLGEYIDRLKIRLEKNK